MDRRTREELQEVVDELSRLLDRAPTWPGGEAGWEGDLAELTLLQHAGDRLVAVLRRRTAELAARR